MRLIQNLLVLFSAASVLAAPATQEKRQATLNGKNLSILPLGDSITYGIGSASSNSYRQFLLTSLQSAGAKVDYVGTVKSGTMADKDNEGHPGWVINQISNAAAGVASAGIKANVVLLHAGTNDCGTYGWEEAHVRLGQLIDVVTSKWPQAAVLVAKIIPSTNANTQSNIKSFNSKIDGIVNQRVSAGKKVRVVNMESALNARTDLSDALHPNDQGFKKMADVWLNGLNAVNGLGWL
ncbi:hypothetical protein Q7P37_011167 [Cladosporium fusiforme]